MIHSVRCTRLDCWHANELIYQADGETDDGKHVYVHYRGGRLSVWVGDGPCGSPNSVGDWIIEARPTDPAVCPSTITRSVLATWTQGVIEWPERIDGYHNEPNNG